MSVNLKEYFEAEKLLSRHPGWIPADRNSLKLSCPLDIDGVTVAGLELCVYALAELPNEEVCVQLQYMPPKTRSFPFCRIDWNPFRGHYNKGKGPEELKFIKFKSTHIHPFDLNFDEQSGKMIDLSLPIAIPLQENPSNFQELLALVAKELKISNMDWVPTPPWQPRLS